MTVRSHARILVSILTDSDFISLSPAAQRMYFVLLAQKNMTNAGVTPWMPSKWAKACSSTSIDDVVAACSELQTARFVFFDEDTDELLVRTFIRNDGIVKQPNVLKNALRVAEQIESADLRSVLADELRKLGRRDCTAVADRLDPPDPEPSSNPSGTLPEPSGIPLTLPEGFPEPCGDGAGDGEKVTLGLKKVGVTHAGARTHAREARPDSTPLPNRCPAHAFDEFPPACGACRDRRLASEQADRDHADAAARRRAEEIAARKAATRAEIDACPMCDDHGYRGTRVCTHDPDEDARRRRGLELVRSHLKASNE